MVIMERLLVRALRGEIDGWVAELCFMLGEMERRCRGNAGLGFLGLFLFGCS